MRRRIFLIPLLWLLVLIPLNSCQPGDDEKGGQPNPLDQAENITMGEEVLLSFPELPYALKNQASVNFPDASTGTVDSMLALMQKNPGLRLLVTGLYDAREDMP
ncbi:MAG: hypothetical protein IH599_09050, partial [Bacteroidales bacterium]|nr:hypothetical protein [Bacteroidales bacterium]